MKTILVVDDEYLIAEILGMALEEAGYNVETASNGAKALEKMERSGVDLIITDYMMPVKNGEELAKAVRNTPAWAHVPIILMSGAQAHIGREQPQLFAGVLDKPFNIDSVIALVKLKLAP